MSLTTIAAGPRPREFHAENPAFLSNFSGKKRQYQMRKVQLRMYNGGKGMSGGRCGMEAATGGKVTGEERVPGGSRNEGWSLPPLRFVAADGARPELQQQQTLPSQFETSGQVEAFAAGSKVFSASDTEQQECPSTRFCGSVWVSQAYPSATTKMMRKSSR